MLEDHTSCLSLIFPEISGKSTKTLAQFYVKLKRLIALNLASLVNTKIQLSKASSFCLIVCSSRCRGGGSLPLELVLPHVKAEVAIRSWLGCVKTADSFSTGSLSSFRHLCTPCLQQTNELQSFVLPWKPGGLVPPSHTSNYLHPSSRQICLILSPAHMHLRKWLVISL